MHTFTGLIPRGLIVSCQTISGDALRSPEYMAAMARSAEHGGAVAIRANGSADISAISSTTKLPIIGINKSLYPSSEIYITPTFADAEEAAEAGADIIALDATMRQRPRGETLPHIIESIHRDLNLTVMADVSTLEEGINAMESGADAIATTLAGYTDGRPYVDGPDLELISSLVGCISKPVIAEGRFDTPKDAAHALSLGAYAVVVGSAITRPQYITERFVSAMLDQIEN